MYSPGNIFRHSHDHDINKPFRDFILLILVSSEKRTQGDSECHMESSKAYSQITSNFVQIT